MSSGNFFTSISPIMFCLSSWSFIHAYVGKYLVTDSGHIYDWGFEETEGNAMHISEALYLSVKLRHPWHSASHIPATSCPLNSAWSPRLRENVVLCLDSPSWAAVWKMSLRRSEGFYGSPHLFPFFHGS